MMEEHNIDKEFKSKLGFYSPRPSADVWKSIESTLDKKQKKVAFIVLKRAAAVLLPLIGLFVFWQVNHKNNADNSTKTTTSPPQIVINNIDTTPNKTQNTPPATFNNVNTADNTNIEQKRGQTGKNLPVDSFISNPNNALAENESTVVAGIAEIKRDAFLPIAMLEANPSENNDLQEQMATNAPSQNRHVPPLPVVEKKQNTQILIGASGGPQISNSVNLANNMSTTGSGMLTYTGGMAVQIKPKRRLTFETGVYYSKLGQESDVLLASVPKNADYATDAYLGSPVAANSTEYNYNANSIQKFDERVQYGRLNNQTQNFELAEAIEYFEIPLNMKYALIKRKMNLNLIYGLGFNYTISKSVDKAAELAIEHTNQTINVGNTLGLGVEVPLKSRFIFSLEPTLKYYFLSNSSIISQDYNPYSLGVMTGLMYRF